MPEAKPTITFAKFQEVDIRIATILEVRPHSNADKLVVLKVSLGKTEERQIVAGIRPYFSEEGLTNLVGKQITIVANLEPRNLRGEESHGMVLAAKDERNFALLNPTVSVEAGSTVG